MLVVALGLIRIQVRGKVVWKPGWTAEESRRAVSEAMPYEGDEYTLPPDDERKAYAGRFSAPAGFRAATRRANRCANRCWKSWEARSSCRAPRMARECFPRRW